MPILESIRILEALQRSQVDYVVIGGVAATLHGSPLPTRDLDICPSRVAENLERLARALREMDARLRVGSDEPNGIPFPCEGPFLAQKNVWNLVTRFGALDLAFEPAGTGGYESLEPRAAHYELGGGLTVATAALEDVIRSKEAANRAKDHQTLPTLRLLLETRRQAPKPPSGDV